MRWLAHAGGRLRLAWQRRLRRGPPWPHLKKRADVGQLAAKLDGAIRLVRGAGGRTRRSPRPETWPSDRRASTRGQMRCCRSRRWRRRQQAAPRGGLPARPRPAPGPRRLGGAAPSKRGGGWRWRALPTERAAAPWLCAQGFNTSSQVCAASEEIGVGLLRQRDLTGGRMRPAGASRVGGRGGRWLHHEGLRLPCCTAFISTPPNCCVGDAGASQSGPSPSESLFSCTRPLRYDAGACLKRVVVLSSRCCAAHRPCKRCTSQLWLKVAPLACRCLGCPAGASPPTG